MNLSAHKHLIAFFLAVPFAAVAYSEYAASLVPGAVVPLAIAGVPASTFALVFLSFASLGVGLWWMPKTSKEVGKITSKDDEPCQEWIGLLAQHMAKTGDKKGLELVSALAVYQTHGEYVAKPAPVKGAKS